MKKFNFDKDVPERFKVKKAETRTVVFLKSLFKINTSNKVKHQLYNAILEQQEDERSKANLN